MDRRPEPSACGTDNWALRTPTTCAKSPSWYISNGPPIGVLWDVTTYPASSTVGLCTCLRP
eukprot:10394883-Prorocentrum_lima.AAC.1